MLCASPSCWSASLLASDISSRYCWAIDSLSSTAASLCASRRRAVWVRRSDEACDWATWSRAAAWARNSVGSSASRTCSEVSMPPLV